MKKFLSICLLVLLLGGMNIALADNNDQQPLWRQVSFPLENFTRYSSRFGWRMMGGQKEFHSGLDMPAPSGSSLRAWASGQVVSASYDNRCGKHITVVSGDWRSTFCHMSALVVQTGQLVEAGQIVGAVGSTGRSTGPHLHWTLRYQGKLVNPELVIQAMQLAWQGQNVPIVPPAEEVPDDAQMSPGP